MKVQSKKGSFLEACVNTAIGFLISLAANPLFCWLFNVRMDGKQMLSYIAAFTVLSVLRSYVIRRWFNHSVENAVNKLFFKEQQHIPAYQSLQPEIDILKRQSEKLDKLTSGIQKGEGYQPLFDNTNSCPPEQSAHSIPDFRYIPPTPELEHSIAMKPISLDVIDNYGTPDFNLMNRLEMVKFAFRHQLDVTSVTTDNEMREVLREQVLIAKYR